MTAIRGGMAARLCTFVTTHPLLLLGLFHGLITGAAWTHATLAGEGVSSIRAASRLMGLILASCAFLQLLLVSRATWLERVYGLDGLTRFHHRVGQVFLVPLIAHPLLVTWARRWWSGESFVDAYAAILAMEGIGAASISACLFLGILTYSLIQPWASFNYQWWYTVHLVLYVAILLAFWHQVVLGESVRASSAFRIYWWAILLFTLTCVACYRVGQPLVRSLRHRFVVSAIVPETRNVTSVHIKGRDLADYKFQSGQFVMVRFLSPRLGWESHPFSLSLPYNGSELRISVKDVGDYSGAVQDIKPGTHVILEGPYGLFTSARSSSSKVLCLAFGIGITPIRTIAEDLGRKGCDVVLVYGSLRSDEIALRDEVEKLAADYKVRVHHVLSEESQPPLPESGELPKVTVSGGFVTRDYLERVVADVAERDVFLCGPPFVMRMVRKDLASLGVPADQIFIEQFSLH